MAESYEVHSEQYEKNEHIDIVSQLLVLECKRALFVVAFGRQYRAGAQGETEHHTDRDAGWLLRYGTRFHPLRWAAALEEWNRNPVYV